MKRIVISVVAAMVLFGCGGSPRQAVHLPTSTTWSAVSNTDEFTDINTRMVTTAEWSGNGLILTRSMSYYPFVGIQNGEIFVGIRSGGAYRIPTGTVQIRIDSNQAWTITPEETPIYLAPAVPGMNPVNSTLDDVQNQAMRNVTKLMSPYTATTGDKARAIIREMLSGKVVKYRIIGMNQAASTTGEAIIDSSFADSLRKIGLNPEEI